MIDQCASKPDTESRARRGFFPTMKTDYDRLCDELGGPADIGFSIPHPKMTLAGYCREHPCVRVLPVLMRFQPDKSCARKHWPWAAFAIAQYAFEQKERNTYTDEPTPKELSELLTQIIRASRKLRSAVFDLDVLSNRLTLPHTEDVKPMASPVSYAKAIRPLFRQIDVDHMKPFDVIIDDYQWMADPTGRTVGDCDNYPDHANARSVLAFLKEECTPQMPLGGPFWYPDMLDVYQRWMDDGFRP